MARAIGLDLGSYSVKALVLETGARGSRQVTFLEAHRPEGDRQETLKAALRELLASIPHAENIAVAAPGTTLALHAVTLPFSDAKRIEATLPFELESQLPFEITETTHDYQVAVRKEGKTQVLAGVARNEDLASLLGLLSELGVDPRVVTHPALAYHSIFASAPQLLGDPPWDNPVAIIDLGHERTSIAVGRPGQGVEWARTFAGGGRDLTRALATELGTPLPEANAWKEQHGAMGEAAHGPEGERASGAFQRGLQAIVREIRATLKAYAAQTRSQATQVYLCGGTSRMPGLPEQLAVDLGLPVVRLPLPQEVQGPVGMDQLPATAQAYALALRASVTGARAPRFNMRRGPYAFKRDTDSVRDQLLRLGMFAGLLFLFFLLFSVTRNTLLSRREKDVDRQLCAVTEPVLGRCEPNYERALNLLRGKESPTADIPKRSALNLLAELTERIPDDLDVKFSQMDIDLERLMLRGDTEGSRQIDSLERALKASPCFKEVQEGKIEKARAGSGVSFHLDVQVQCPDSEAPHEQHP